MATEEYVPVTSMLEGVVIVKKNPAYMAEEEDKK